MFYRKNATILRLYFMNTTQYHEQVLTVNRKIYGFLFTVLLYKVRRISIFRHQVKQITV